MSSERVALQYGTSLVAVLTAVLIRAAADPLLGDSLPLVTLFGAVGIAVWYGGLRPAALATVLGYVLCAYFFIPPRGAMGLDHVQNVVGLIAYLFTCTLIIGFGESSRRARLGSEIQRDLLRVTMASMGDAVITTDQNAKVTSMNPMAERLTGWKIEDAQSLPLETIFRIINEHSRSPVANPAVQALVSGVVVDLANHTLLIRKDGSELPIDDSAAPILSSNGAILGTVLIFRDVAERREAEQVTHGQLSAAQFLASIVESSEDAIISKLLDGTIRSWNQSAERLFGYGAAEIVGQHISRLIPVERLAEEDEIIQRLRNGERVEHFETMRVRRDGKLVPVSLTISPVKNDAGEIVGASKIVRDITKSKEIEAVLTASERELNDFFENAVVGLHWVGPDGIILRANHADMAMLGYSHDEYVGQHIANFHVDQPVIEEILSRLANGEIIHNYPARLICKNGSIKDVLIDSSVLWNGDEFIHTRCFTRDVTAQKRAEEALREADRRKDEFLAMLAHELRNPLAPIKNSLEILKRSSDNPSIIAQSCSIMERQIGQMIRLIDDLLDISRVTRGNFTLRKQPTEIQSALQQAVEACKPIVEQLGHHLDVNIPSHPVFVCGDPVRLSQIFVNLLTNACKYTDPGGKIRLEMRQSDQMVFISVTDSGIGIPADFTDRVFEMFVQVDGTLERTQGGLGIGLTLVKKLVELHGGHVSAYSAGLGHGSKFTIEFPMMSPAENAPSLSPNEPLRLKNVHRILVVDDNQDSAQTLTMLLNIHGNETIAAHDGGDAIRLAKSFRPALMLLDIGLPTKNGYEVCQYIREQDWGKNLFIVAMTGWGQEEDRRKSNSSGFDAHLVKPVEFEKLSAILNQLESVREVRT